MDSHLKKPVLIIGIGGAGASLAPQARQATGYDSLVISNDTRDLAPGIDAIHVPTDPVINPSVQMIRGSAYDRSGQIAERISGYPTVLMIGNLAGRAGAGMAPVIADICAEHGKALVSFVIMPFKYEKDRIFSSGVALERVRENSDCTIVLDNDSMLENNPDLSPKDCYKIGDAAIMHVMGSPGSLDAHDTNVVAAGRDSRHMEDSLRDALKMLYSSTTPDSVRRSIIYVAGGSNVPVGMLNSVSSLAHGVIGESATQIGMSSEESGIVILSSVHEMAKFRGYDPLGMIPQEKTLDWSMPERSISCELDLHQIE